MAVGGLKTSIGKKDKPVRLKKGKTLLALLDWVSDQPVVFHDVGDRRAWLVDGPSALLHLVRASIERDRDREAYGSYWEFDGSLQGDSPLKILSDRENLDTALYHDPDETAVPYTFRDRVREVVHNLELLVDYQVLSTKKDGYWISKTGAASLKHAVGWDFWDVAKPPHVVSNRTHCLRVWGRGWVDYIRHTGAMVIFGSGFGELIRAETPDSLCPGWKTVRTGDELLCTSIQTLKKVQQTRGGTSLCPGELATDIIWSSRCELFKPCQCLGLQPPGGSSHADPVQVLLPKRKILRLDTTGIQARITLRELDDSGAVVFGHTPYLNVLPKMTRHRRSSDEEQGHSRNGSSGGSSAEQTMVGEPSVRGPHSPAAVEPTSATKGPGRFAAGPQAENIETGGSPAKKRKRLSWIRSLFCGVPFPTGNRRGRSS